MAKKLITNFDDAWLGLGDLDSLSITDNRLLNRSEDEIEKPDLHLMRLFLNPKYLGSTVKLLFDIELHPIQIAILQEFWVRPFPMFIASRGFGKAEDINNDILTVNGWKKMKDIKIGDQIYGRDGLPHNVTAIHPQGKKQVCRITLADGRFVDCCEDHLWVVRRNDGRELTVDTKKIIESNGIYKKGYKYRIPNCEPIEFKKQELPIDPYILGCLIGDGCLTTLTPKISTNDQFIVDEFRKRLPEYKIELDTSTNNYTIVDKNKVFEKITRKNGVSYFGRNRNRLVNIIRKLKLNVSCYNKFIPEIYKNSCIEDRLELIRGLIDTDGSITKHGAIEFTNTSQKLVKDIMDVLRSLGISCSMRVDNRVGQMMTLPQGTEIERRPYFRVFINTSLPIAKLPRKLERIKKSPTNSEKFVSIIKAEKIDDYVEMQCITVDSPDHTYITKDYIVTHNSFLMALYCVLKCTFNPGTKIVVVGAAFRQSKLVFEYMETIWRNSSILRNIFNGNEDGPRRDVDRCTMRLGDSWTVAIPLGDGSKIRGLRAHIIIADEFASISPDIYETVVSGFAAVSANPIQNVKDSAKRQAMMDAGLWSDELEELKYKMGNQTIIAGTADYSFKHFASYWRRYKGIIQSGGDRRKLEELFKGEVPENFNWKDFCIIRMPYELIPKGFMDDKQVSRAKATIHTGIYNMEYAACFISDSEGFFRRSLIESCVASENKPLILDGKPAIFDAITVGNPNLQYIYGIDPASEQDNFSIVVLEIHPSHSRIVYCWTTNRSNFKDRQKIGMTTEHDFYGFCARKIRNLMKIFPCARIGMDAQGGGVAIEEALHDPSKLEEGENLIFPVIDPNKFKDTDDLAGLHLLELVQFAKADWTSQANHGLRKDLEDKVLLFPRFDSLTIGLALENEGKDILNTELKSVYDSKSECILEIEDLKNELTTIVMTQTSTGPNARDRWDTPELKLPNGKRGRLRKDRYSSLLIANMLARQMNRAIPAIQYDLVGGNARDLIGGKGALYKGPDWYVNPINENGDDIFMGVYR